MPTPKHSGPMPIVAIPILIGLLALAWSAPVLAIPLGIGAWLLWRTC